LPPVEYDCGVEVRRGDEQGWISYRGQLWRIGRAFAGQPLGARPTGRDGVYEVLFLTQVIKEPRAAITVPECAPSRPFRAFSGLRNRSKGGNFFLRRVRFGSFAQELDSLETPAAGDDRSDGDCRSSSASCRRADADFDRADADERRSSAEDRRRYQYRY